jgi:peptidyl-prolyl cis-trans isomerase SurA
MKKLFFAILLFLVLKAQAQTLFTYGKDSVSVKEFLQAFNKNNNGNKSAKALQDYLDLYINSRLKIREAKERGYDTLPQLLSDMENLRSQILPAYERDAESMNKLVDEAFTRSQKDIHLAHIFIGFKNASGETDSIKALQKANEAYSQLQHNASFADIAKKYSDDPSVQQNGGDVGFITVFTLPYELENLAYNTPAGKISSLYKSKSGYHIFKNLGERKALGRVKAAQILLAFPPETSETQKQKIKLLADSLYNRLQKGDDMAKLAAQFSNDYISAAAKGTIPEFGVGQFSPDFENKILSLKDGETSKPFLTAYGYHIVKRISITPVNANKEDAASMQNLKEKIEQNDRINITKDALMQKVLKTATIRKMPFQNEQLWAYSDSVLNARKPNTVLTMNSSTPLIKIGDKTITVGDWMKYIQTFRYKSDGSGFKPYNQLWDEFMQNSALNYYKANLELFNNEFRSQMNEFKEGNLFFEIMQRQIWNPAQTDTTALQDYYQKHQSAYVWDKSARAVIFYASDAATAQSLANQIKKSPGNWKRLVAGMEDKVTADSGRFEWQQIPNANNTPLKAGLVTAPVVNKTDNTYSFAYITQVYTQPSRRNFEEAKGLVVNDYQNELEKKWIAELKAKYPVVINQKALQQLKP